MATAAPQSPAAPAAATGAQQNEGPPKPAGQEVLEAIDKLAQKVRDEEEHAERLKRIGDTLGDLTPKLQERSRRNSKVRVKISPPKIPLFVTLTTPCDIRAYRSCKPRSGS